MRKIFAACACALLCALLATGCAVDEMTTLKEVSRPYVGEYRCKRLLLGGEDRTEEYDLVLSLGYHGELSLRARNGTGEHTLMGNYELDGEAGALLVTPSGGERKLLLPYREGVVSLGYVLGGKLLYAEFSMGD